MEEVILNKNQGMFNESFSKFQLTVLYIHDPLTIRFSNKEPLYFGSTMLTNSQ